ncbi:MAG: ATP-binding response regulator [Methanobacteriota archaeon]
MRSPREAPVGELLATTMMRGYAAAVGRATDRALKVLVVEDNPRDVALLRDLLGGPDGGLLYMETADRLSKALARLRASAFDAAFVDLGLPDSVGIPTIERIEERNPDLPIVVLTGVADEDLAIEALRCGAQDYLVKGHVAGRELYRAARYAVERKSTEVALRGEQERRFFETRQIERLAEVDALKTRLLENAAQELRAPLAPIRLELGLLEAKGGLPEEARRSFAVIARNVDRLARMVDEAQEVLEADAGRLGFRREVLDLSRVVAASVEARRGAALERDVALRVSASPVEIEGDAARLGDAVERLLENAIRFTGPGGAIEVEVKRTGGNAVVRVRDTGAGIGRDDLARLFQPYFRSIGAAASGGGAGLGLYIARRIVEAHGGRIWAESRGEGRGSTFAFAVPVRKAEPP